MLTKRAFVIDRARKNYASIRLLAAAIFLALAIGTTACSNTMQSLGSNTSGVSTGSSGPVHAGMRIQLSAASTSVGSGGTLQFTALTQNTHLTAIQWSASM